MNKTQLMVDVVKTMKEKEGFQGTWKTEAQKDQVTILNVDREFSKNAETGVTHVKTEAKLDLDGKTVKRESNTELNLKDFDVAEHPGLMRLIRWRHGMRSGSLKQGLNRFSLFLHLLNDMNLEEKEDQSYALSLSMEGFPEEIREIMDDRIKQRELDPYFEGSPLQELIQKIQAVKDPSVKMNMVINKNYEVERIVRDFSGKLKDEHNTEHQWNVKTELCLVW